MKIFENLRGAILGDAAKQERHPIRTPIRPRELQSSVTAAGDNQLQNGNDIELTTNYNTMQEVPRPTAAVQDAEGGYVGPAAESREARGRPPSLSKYTTRGPQDGWWWQRGGVSCTTGEQTLVFLSGCLLVLLLFLLVTVFFVSSGVWRRRISTCTSRECVKTAGEVLRSLNEEVSPCENFVDFVCGGWLRQHPIPEGKHRWGVFDVLDQQTLVDLRAQWDTVGLRPLLDLVVKEGGLPMVDPSWTGDHYQVMTSLARLRNTLAGEYLISLIVKPDSRNTSKPVIYIGEGMLPVQRVFLTPQVSTSHKEAQITYMRETGKELLKELRQERNNTFIYTLYRDIDDLWDFYVRVAEITTPKAPEENPWDTYHPMTVYELQNFTDSVNASFRINWLGYLNQVFEGTTITITWEDRVIVEYPKYLIQLLLLLQDTPKRTIANYLLFPVVVEMGEETNVRYLTRPHHALPRLQSTWSLGRAKSWPWHDCTQKTRMLLPLGVASVYVRHIYKQQLGDMAKEVVEDVTGAFRKMLTSSLWMDSDTLKEALQKLDNMYHLVAFPELVLNDQLLEQYHLGLPPVSKVDHFGNMVGLVTWYSRRSLQQLTVLPSRDRWPRGPLETNAFYAPLQNSIVIPVAVLQEPIFHPEKTTGLNYGSLGAITGHEITHGFDINGRTRGWTGSLQRWWTNSTLQQYTNKTSCFVQQYSGYDVSSLLPPQDRPPYPMMINGLKTKGENIADNDGLRAAWVAYRSRMEKDGEEVVELPGLQHYTQDQLFFIGFGKVWCCQHTRFALEYLLAVDPHSPNPYRILGALQNSRDFSEAFNCPSEAPMNPSKKCVLW
ncbi:endothelin-converting enzyme 2-like isoform X2 [Homarus americanus]|uniref:endothelin-converting enzyme 2-like isoform X2 n=1 Tax=Homarus americanus TaxID=6706 RepID=UPI001C47B04D|nr:endothelin-converting enzyme 2-like isoform X2 [Homarus americanus]